MLIQSNQNAFSKLTYLLETDFGHEVTGESLPEGPGCCLSVFDLDRLAQCMTETEVRLVKSCNRNPWKEAIALLLLRKFSGKAWACVYFLPLDLSLSN